MTASLLSPRPGRLRAALDILAADPGRFAGPYAHRVRLDERPHIS